MGSGDSSRSCETSSQDLGYCPSWLVIALCFSYYPAENLIEYKWPPDETGEYCMLQEQVSEYLGVTSFKRKYPDLERRDLSHKEKLYLRELNVITETQCTLGLTALRSDEVIDLMIKEYPAKHAEYSVILQEKERQRITDHYKEYSQMQQQNTQKVEASKVPEYIKKAAKKAAEFNSSLNRERMEERRAYFDLQTHVIQVPQGKYKVLPTERTKVSSYPVALIPGQFQEYYKRYSPDELRYLPLNTALYEPPLDPELPALDSDGDSDDAEDGRGAEKRRNEGTSDSSSGNVSEGEGLPDSQEEPLPGRPRPKDKAATPRKDAAKRSVLPKSAPGYKAGLYTLFPRSKGRSCRTSCEPWYVGEGARAGLRRGPAVTWDGFSHSSGSAGPEGGSKTDCSRGVSIAGQERVEQCFVGQRLGALFRVWSGCSQSRAAGCRQYYGVISARCPLPLRRVRRLVGGRLHRFMFWAVK
ncbi:PHD finger protein 10 isoform X4 [Myotis yumanensis]